MNRKVIGILVAVILVAGFVYFYLNWSKSKTMLDYLEETDDISKQYIALLIEESKLETEEELETYTIEQSLPTLNNLISESERINEQYRDKKLLTVHALLIDSLKTLVLANEAWLDYSDEAEQLFIESDELHSQYESELEELATGWGVEIEWFEYEG